MKNLVGTSMTNLNTHMTPLNYPSGKFSSCLLNSDPDAVFSKITIEEEQKQKLLENIAKKMAPQPSKIRTDFEINCFTTEGVDALKEALLTAKAEVNKEETDAANMINVSDFRCNLLSD